MVLNYWVQQTETLEQQLAHAIGQVARVSATRPKTVICIWVVVIALSCIGLTQTEILSEGEVLWTDQNSEPRKNELLINEEFSTSATSGTEASIVRRDKETGALQNVITKDALAEAFAFHDEVLKLEVATGDELPVRFEDICLPKDFSPDGHRDPESGCSISGVLRFWNFNSTLFHEQVQTDEDVQQTLAQPVYPDSVPVVRVYDLPGFEEVSEGIATAQGIVLRYSTRTRQVESGDVDDGGDEASINLEVTSGMISDWESAFIDLLTDEQASPRDTITITGQAAGSLDDELERAVGGDIILMVIAFILMINVGATTLGRPCDSLQGRTVVGLSGVSMVAIAGFAAYGLAGGFGVPFTSLQQILPFLLLGIGLDDGFVVIASVDQTDKSKPIPDRMYTALRDSGMSITVTSLTDICALLLGSMSRLPAVEWFCYYAALSILYIYVSHLTIYVSLVTLDEQRRLNSKENNTERGNGGTAQTGNSANNGSYVNGESGNNGSYVSGDVNATKSGNETPHDNEAKLSRYALHATKATFMDKVSVLLADYYAPFLTRKPVKAFVVIFFTAIAATAGSQIPNLGRAFSSIDLTPDDSFARDHIEANIELYGNEFPPLQSQLYFKGMQYHTYDTQDWMRRLIDEIRALETIDAEATPVSDWHQEFTDFARATYPFNESMSDDNRFVVGETVFYEALNTFLETPAYSRFLEDLLFESPDERTQLAFSRMTLRHLQLTNTEEEIKTLEETQNVTKFMSDASDGILEPKPFIHSEVFQFFDQYRIILPEAIRTLSLVIVAVLLICVFVLVHPVSVLILAGTLAFIFIDLLASLVVWGLNLNSISMVNLVMALGLVVDYSAHVVHSFGLQDPKKSRDERMIETMRSIGPAVLLGCFTTFLGVVPLAFANSEVFRVFFRSFLSIVIVGGTHGLIFVPVVLSLVGPSLPRSTTAQKKQENAGSQEEEKTEEEAEKEKTEEEAEKGAIAE